MNNNWISIALICTILSSFGVVIMKYIDNSKYSNVIFMIISYIGGSGISGKLRGFYNERHSRSSKKDSS